MSVEEVLRQYQGRDIGQIIVLNICKNRGQNRDLLAEIKGEIEVEIEVKI